MKEIKWQHSLALMVCVQATVSASNQVAGPFLPLYLQQLGLHPLGAVEYWTGAIMAVPWLAAAVFAPMWGGMGDRTGRKAMILRSTLANGFATFAMGLCNAPWELFAVRVVGGAFSGFSTAAMALLSTQVPEERLGYTLGWLSTGQISGALIGPLIGGLLADHFHDYRTVFFFAAAGTIVLASGSALLVHETAGQSRILERDRPTMLARLNGFARHRDLAPMFLVILLAQVAAFGLQPILPLFVAHLVGDASWRGTVTGAAVAITGLAGVMAAPFLGRRSDIIGYRPLLLISLAGAACFTIPQAFVTEIWQLLSLRFGVGIFLGGILPSANALIGRLTKPEERGQIYGITSSAQFLGRFIGPLLGAGVAAHFGFSAVFILIGALMLTNLAWVSTQVSRARDFGAHSRG